MLTTECIYDIKNSNNHPETLKDIKKHGIKKHGCLYQLRAVTPVTF